MAKQNYQNTWKTFDIHPKIILRNKKTKIHIAPLFAKPLEENCKYKVTAAPMEYDIYNENRRKFCITKCVNNTLTCEFLFEKEQEYRLLLSSSNDNFAQTVAVFHVFCVKKDLYNKRPYKGDFHLHSFYSDGSNNPGFIAASCRKSGLDFMAITDHREYTPSIEAKQDFENVDIDLNIFPGEEIHPPNTKTHMVGFGAIESVKKHFADKEKYVDMIKNKCNQMADKLADLKYEQEKFEYVSCLYCIDKVRKAGGICIFAHPYWATGNRYNVSTPLTEKFLKDGCFDAFELFNGDYMDINTLQLSLYHDMYKEYNIPLVSGTDAHGVINHHFFGSFHTIVYSEDCQFESLTDNIKKLNSVTVMPRKDDAPFVFGRLRFVKLTMFLLREVIPAHDELCKEEGILMESTLKGSTKAVRALTELKGQVKDYYNKIYGIAL